MVGAASQILAAVLVIGDPLKGFGRILIAFLSVKAVAEVVIGLVIIVGGLHRFAVVDFRLLIVFRCLLHFLVRIALVHLAAFGHQVHGIFAELFRGFELLVALADGRQLGFGLGLYCGNGEQYADQ